MEKPDLGDSRSRGLQALGVANAAFAQLPDEELDALAARAIKEARAALGITPVITLNRVGVSRTRTLTQGSNASAPSLTATLSSTPS